MQRAQPRSDGLAGSPAPREECESTHFPPGDPIAALYDEHAARVFHYLLSILGDRAEAEDALQSIFVEVVRRPGLLEVIHSPRTYLLTMARNFVQRSQQQASRRRQAEQRAGEDRLLKARDSSLHDADEAAALQLAILGLPQEQREVLVLKVFEDLTFRDVAAVLGISENTAASRYRYALDKLRANCNPPKGGS